MKTLLAFATLFLLVGIVILGIGVVNLNQTRVFLSNAASAPGVVTEISRQYSSSSNGSGYSYYPHVEFTAADGQVYRFKSNVGSNPASYQRGERVQVLYAQNNPQEARIDSFFSVWGAVLILAIVGSVFSAFGGSIVGMRIYTKQKIAWLKQAGQRITVDIKEIYQNTNLRVNGRSPWRIDCQWHNPRSGEMTIFKSENIWFDPTEFVERKQLEVLIDPANPKKYHVDVSFLPNQS